VALSVITIAVATSVIFLQRDNSSTEETGAEPLKFIEIVVTDLTQEETFDGILGSVQDDPVKTQRGGTITKIPSPGETVRQGDSLFSLDGKPVILFYGVLPTFRDITAGDESTTISSQLAGTITWIAERGEVIQQGEVLFRVNDRPVIVLYGNIPAHRSLEYRAESDTSVTAEEALDAANQSLMDSQEALVDAVDAAKEVEATASYDATTQAGLVADAIKAAEDSAEAQAELVSTAKEPLDEAISQYSDEISGWFGSTVSAEDRIIKPLDLAEKWGKTVDEIFKEQKSVRSTPDDDPSTPWNELVVWVWLHLTPYPVVFDCESTQSNARCPSAEIEDAWEAKTLVDDAWADAIETSTNAALTHDDLVEAAQHNMDEVARAHQILIDTAQDNIDGIQDDIEAATRDIVDASDSYNEATSVLKGPDVLQLEKALIDLGFDADGKLNPNGIFSQDTLEAVLAFQTDFGLEADGVVDQGEVVFLTGPSQVTDHLHEPGDQATGAIVKLSTGKPTTGTDVLQLEKGLIDLGYGADGKLNPDGIFSPETVEAVLAFQADNGLEEDGIVDQGEIVFLPGPVRITNQLATEGSAVSSGSVVLGISLSPKVVRIDLPADQQGLMVTGNKVTVELPDFTKVPATVLSVSQTAELPQSGPGPATFDVLIELDDPSRVTELDEAPVDVIVVSDSVEDVLAVPVSALLALLEGGYAVEIDAGNGQTRLTAIEVGLFDGKGMIEIISPELGAGDRLVVP
jgi:peptidoglycan hydrolase-like protein with peptidoglycan-binding domain